MFNCTTNQDNGSFLSQSKKKTLLISKPININSICCCLARGLGGFLGAQFNDTIGIRVGSAGHMCVQKHSRGLSSFSLLFKCKKSKNVLKNTVIILLFLTKWLA